VQGVPLAYMQRFYQSYQGSAVAYI